MTSRPTRRLLTLPATGLALALTLAACGGSSDESVSAPAPAPSAAASAAASAPACPITAKQVPAPAGSTTDLKTKPVVKGVKGPAPTELTYADIVVGDGAEAVTGSQVTVKYVGAFYDTGKDFDSSG